MTSLKEQCLTASFIIAHSVVDDAHWRAFGYKQRPRRPKLFKAFLSASKLEHETILLQELWAASFATIFCWAFQNNNFTHRITFMAKLMEYCIDGLDQPLWSALRFSSREDATHFVYEACQDYSQVRQPDHARIFLKRCIARLTGQIPKVWLVGAAWLFGHPDSLVFTATYALNQVGLANNRTNDLEISDKRFLTLMGQCFVEASK